jgi:hypothetical protein
MKPVFILPLISAVSISSNPDPAIQIEQGVYDPAGLQKSSDTLENVNGDPGGKDVNGLL